MDITLAPASAPPVTAQDLRARLVATLRRDLVGPGPDDRDLAEECLGEPPGRWYLTGFIAPAQDGEAAPDDPAEQEEAELFVPPEEAADPQTGSARAEDDPADDPAAARRRFMPSSLGLTVLLPARVREVEVEASWGDYVTEPPLPPELLVAPEGGEQRTTKEDRERAPTLLWRRVPGCATVRLAVPDGRMKPNIVLSGSSAAGFGGGALVLEAHARPYDVHQPDGSVDQVQAFTIVLVNRRARPRRRYADLAYAFQARLEVRCPEGIRPRRDLSGYDADDSDRRLADLQFRDVEEFAVGRNTSAGWERDLDGTVRRAWTDPLPQHEVERVEPAPLKGVEWEMERLAELAAAGDAGPLRAALGALPDQYEAWIKGQEAAIPAIKGPRRRQTATTLAEQMRMARGRITAGIELLGTDARARLAFRAMNEAMARAARQRNAGQGGDPAAVRAPEWRPFQLAFILLNLPGLADKRHGDREIVDLLFFPTGGGKTEAYLGLAAWTIAHRRLANGGVLGAGRRRADALHPAPAHARSARPRGGRRLRAGADARGAGLAGCPRPPLAGRLAG